MEPVLATLLVGGISFVAYPVVQIVAKQTSRLVYMFVKKQIYYKKIKAGFNSVNYHRVSKYMYKLRILDEKYDMACAMEISKKYNVVDEDIFSKEELFVEFCENMKIKKQFDANISTSSLNNSSPNNSKFVEESEEYSVSLN